ncbi:SPRY domain-containing protein 7 [Dermatophagoides farinae]|uniref:SPRY domain-containing protein 7 n=2 Tax=Dermatophagoides farinae TaxID=6954 RepID=A0A922IHA5_DERFA|nr:spry domain-containing protein 7-like [Dermatophagoides farinae]KAH9529788.1 SPRY domain-containing protein 7 [Dermatophagoides farinae]
MDYLFCLNRCFGFQSTRLTHFEQSFNEICLDGTSVGNDVVIIKKGRRICGSGGAITNFPIVQNKAYFEAKVQQSGNFGIGLATSNVDLNTIPLGTDSQSWVLRQDGTIVHDNKILYQLGNDIQEGDIIAILYDHVELRFHINNKPIEYEVRNVKGSEIYPVVYVDNGTIIDMYFSNFTHQPPSSFDAILIEKALL